MVISQVTAGPEQRQQALSVASDKFHRSLAFGLPTEAAELVEPSKRVEFLTRQRALMQKQTIVSLDMQDIEFNADADEAIVTVSVKYFARPTQYVETREDKEKWRYSRFDLGWMYDGLEGSEERGRAALDSHLGR